MLSYIRKVADVRKDEGASAVEYGLHVDIVPDNFTTKDLAQAIANHFAADERG